MLESSERIVNGLKLILKATGVGRGVIAVEMNKPDAVESMQAAVKNEHNLSVLPLKTKYPQGSEKQIINVVTGREVPRGKLPIDAGVLVFNVSTAAAIADAVLLGKPLIERITTVTGCVKTPSNLRLRVGTTYVQAFEACGGLCVRYWQDLCRRADDRPVRRRYERFHDQGDQRHCCIQSKAGSKANRRKRLHPLRKVRAGLPDRAASRRTNCARISINLTWSLPRNTA